MWGAMLLAGVFLTGGLRFESRAGVHDAGGPWDEAKQNAQKAHEAFLRSHRLMEAWYENRGKDNYLLPRNLNTRVWEIKDSAADLWPFLVLTAYLTDRDAFQTTVRRTLLDEIRLTRRLGWLSDDLNIDSQHFVHEEVDLDRLIFGNSEYAKDGLLPIIELTGRNAWFDRARGLVEEIFSRAPIDTRFGPIPSDGAEVNGEILQLACRLYSATGEPAFRRWAQRIGDAYFFDVLPKNNDLPAHRWNFSRGKPISDLLSLRDHGNEIIFGLSELALLEHIHGGPRAGDYLAAMRRMVDRLLEIGVNEDGLWYQRLEPSTGRVLDDEVPDTWGYSLNAVYVLYLMTGESRYRTAVERALQGIGSNERYLWWSESAGPADAFADSIEGSLYLLNRIPDPAALRWLDRVVPIFLAFQRPDGIVEGWHGDGNYARTALMYALMKTAGARIDPWKPEVKFGARREGETLHLVIWSEKEWQGRVHFDYPRHREHLSLTVNYPRLNEFPEWYTVERSRLYRVVFNGQEQEIMLGESLIEGLPLRVGREPLRVGIRPAQDGKSAVARPGRVIEIRSKGIELSYDVTEIHAKSGETLTIRYDNSDSEMAHNIVLVKSEDDIMPVGIAALKAYEREFVPEDEMDRILAFSKTAYPGDIIEFTFVVPPPGTYPYICTHSGHFTMMQGRLISSD